MFEIEVINQETSEKDFIIFDIEIQKNTLCASHVGLTRKEEKSQKIAFKKIALDPFYSLDHHLNELHDICINAILQSDFYILTE